MRLNTDRLSFFEALTILVDQYGEQGWQRDDVVSALEHMIEDLTERRSPPDENTVK